MVKGSEIDGVEVPEAMIETLNRTLGSLQQLETELPQFLSLSDPDLLAQLPLLQRAQSLFSLAKLASTLFSLKLRCRGANPNDHPVKSELDKINVLQKKLERLARLSEAQEQDTRNMNGGEGPERNYEERAGQKRKYPSSEEPSVQIDHMESLEKVKEELLGYNTENVKGTVVIDISDDDDEVSFPFYFFDDSNMTALQGSGS
ncbi:hypothetical protein VNO80_02536 [Phaseolus coccineus]|uniref:Nuclear nucleic acid-binding protein C1D n=1 Tax=Phaseolus coccineus TaxID=3886 RepID=A0AAN9NQ46_PHACN